MTGPTPAASRLDRALVRLGHARSRNQAQELVAAGRVRVEGRVVTKPGRTVTTTTRIEVTPPPDGEEYASRAAAKLEGALHALGDGAPRVSGRRALDAGASTGGFTDVLLRRGARAVVAVDVGEGQLVERLAQDPRVLVRDRTNVRELGPTVTEGPIELAVADLSFISLRLVIPALVGVCAPGADLLLMVKPQFELGPHRSHGGIVTDPGAWAEAIAGVLEVASAAGLTAVAIQPSPVPGAHGNREFFVHLRRSSGAAETADRSAGCDMIQEAVRAAAPSPNGRALGRDPRREGSRR